MAMALHTPRHINSKFIMKKVVPIIGLALTCLIVSCSQEKKLVRKASNAVERSDFEQALYYYDQVLKKDSNSYYANAGKGVVLSEYMLKHGEAIPYLERALKKSPEKTNFKINNDLGKSYHFIGNYPRALYFYAEASRFNKPGAPDYDQFLYKRVADCNYAIEHPEVAPVEEQWVKTVGNGINTGMPEYGAVYTHNKLIFTSKRKDDDKEKKNGVDGRYFDAMYVSYVNGDSYSAPRRYSAPDIRGNENFREPHESVVSVTPDGKTLYIYRAGQLYEVDLNDSTKSAHQLDNNINFSYLQSHATLSADGNRIIFASEAEKGIGGLDLYTCTKNEKGNWSPAQLLSNDINTIYNEDSPYLSPNGTLYFSSNGLPGYGGYDVYKSKPEGFHWGKPENLGQPINSPGDEVYFTLTGNTSNGYYTSVRPGGLGDMDIYKVHYMSTEIPDCGTSDSLLAMNVTPQGAGSMVYNFSAEAPTAYAANVRSYNWKVNGTTLPQSSNQLSYTFSTPGKYTISAKAIAYCDTCPTLMVFCSERVIDIQPMLTSNDSLNNKAIAAVPEPTRVKNSTTRNSVTDQQVMSEPQLRDVKWVTNPVYFDFDKSDIRADSKTVLDQNISVLKKNKTLAVKIDGYADSRGTEQYNIGLSGRRANAVKNYLIENGIPKSRILGTRSFGETMLVNDCSDGIECSEAEHQLNRRVQFEVINLVKTPSDITLN
jgi:outer membrane protein OmpA-like peptidoglycan-associated protein/tetratricopeptide (TPR) repeat protein